MHPKVHRVLCMFMILGRRPHQQGKQIMTLLKGPLLVKEEDIVPKLPPHTAYSKFTISRRGLGEKDYRDALEGTAYKTANLTLKLLKEKCPLVTDNELSMQVVSKVMEMEDVVLNFQLPM